MLRPLLIVTAYYAAGIVAGDVLEIPLSFAFCGAFFIAGLTVLLRGHAKYLLPALFFAAGCCAVRLETEPLSPLDLRVLVGTHTENCQVLGRLVETPVVREGSRAGQTQFRSSAALEIHAFRHSESDPWQPAIGRVQVLAPGSLSEAFYGGRLVEIDGVLSPPRRPYSETSFDYGAFLRRQNIHYVLATQGAPDWSISSLESITPPRPLSDRFLDWSRLVLARGLPEDESLRLLWAMTLGWKTGMTEEVNEPFIQSGTMHIFAISGLHIALLAGVFMALLRACRMPRFAAGLLVVPAIWFYIAATGWQASAIRSGLMTTLVLASWMLRRPGDLLNSLGASALLILLWDPLQLFQASFQLSFFVVLSIALLAPGLYAIWENAFKPDPLLAEEMIPVWRRRIAVPLRWIGLSLATSFAAWAGSLPLMAHHFHLLTISSVAANLLVIPASSLALMSNLGSLCCGTWLPAVGELFNWSAWFWMNVMLSLSHTAAEAPGAYIYLPDPGWIAMAAAGLFLALCAWFFRTARTRSALASFGMIPCVILFATLGGRPACQVRVLPLGAGSAAVIRAGGPFTASLLNSGNSRSGEHLLTPFLHDQGINRLDLLALGQTSARAAGGAPEIAREFRPKAVILPPGEGRSGAYRKWKSNLAPSQLPPRDSVPQGWEVFDLEMKESPGSNSSVAFRFSQFGRRLLWIGGLNVSEQLALLRSDKNLAAEIMVVEPSADGGSPLEALLDAANPRLLIIADSEFPATARAPAALRRRLKHSPCPVWYCRDTGVITIEIEKNGWRARTMDGREFSRAD
jgi:competence protein ComEC